MIIVNCMASSSRFHIPPPQARTASSAPTPAPKTASSKAQLVRIMQMTQEFGTQRSVKRDKPAPKSRNRSIKDVMACVR